MPSLNRRSTTGLLALMAVTLIATTPASAQFGGIKKKLKGDAAAKAADKAGVEPTAGQGGPAASAATEGTLVLTPEVVDRLIAGLKARDVEREKAKKEDTPYGRYNKAKAAYEVAQPKCQAAMQPGIMRIGADEKKMAQYQKYTEKMAEAGTRQDTTAQLAYNDSAMAMIDPSCRVRQPTQPSGYYDQERAIDNRAEQAVLKVSGFTAQELGQVSDRAIGILTNNGWVGDASAGEKAAVKAKDPELKSLLGLREAQEERVAKQAPAPAPAAVTDTAPQPTVAVPPGAAMMHECQVKNAEAHQAEIQALGDRGSAAEKAGNTALMMAIADSINRIMYQGCKRP
jgi:hypothetical protein